MQMPRDYMHNFKFEYNIRVILWGLGPLVVLVVILLTATVDNEAEN